MKITARTENQKRYLKALYTEDLVICEGMASVGKDFVAVGVYLDMILGEKHKQDKLIITRPLITCGPHDIGSLPGPQPVDAKIATPYGWCLMGDIKIGDYVIGRDGTPKKVLSVFDKGYKKVYKINTTDGRSTECCEDHAWYTFTSEERKRGKSGNVRFTKEIMDSLINKKGKLNHSLPRNELVNYTGNNLPLAPYTLGALLGDGSLSSRVVICNPENELLNRVNKEVAEIGCTLTDLNRERFNNNIVYYIKNTDKLYNNMVAKKVKVTDINTGEFSIYESSGLAIESGNFNINKSALRGRCEKQRIINNQKFEFIDKNKRWSNNIKEIIFNLGLLHKNHLNKFIPDIYKYSSAEDRINLLRGLMDTDGTIKSNGEAAFCSTSKQLCLDLIEVVQSLGGKAKIISRGIRGENKNRMINGRTINSTSESFEFTVSLPENINPFYIKRKASLHSCKGMHHIKIESIEPAGIKHCKCIKIEGDEELYLTDNFIVTHNTVNERTLPYALPIIAIMNELLGVKDTRLLLEKKIVEFIPLELMRGYTFTNSCVLLSEMQNSTPQQAVMAITRMGLDSHFCFNGDPNQKDLKVYSGLEILIDTLSKTNLCGYIRMGPEDNQRNPKINSILKAIDWQGAV